ncbi:MAG: SDR family oxidoreductase [Spirochaetota bacterium]|nr:MAG: SDR family oxidoreductase [Spirochaetota bacterium]
MKKTINKVAVITGGGTGIGAATAEELAGIGMNVVVVGRRPEPLKKVASRINSKGGSAIAHPADISIFNDMEKLSKTTVEKFGHVDLVVANASVHDQSSIDSGDPEWWKTVILINVVGLLYTVRAFLPQMYLQGKGHIIIVSSLSGRITYVGEPVYITSKHAQVAFTECLRQEAIPKGIKVTIIEPGLVETPFIDNPLAQELKKTVSPLDPEDVARAIRFAFEQPPNCTIYELSLRPIKQLL